MFVRRSTYDREIANRDATIAELKGAAADGEEAITQLGDARAALRKIALMQTAKSAPAARRMAAVAEEYLFTRNPPVPPFL